MNGLAARLPPAATPVHGRRAGTARDQRPPGGRFPIGTEATGHGRPPVTRQELTEDECRGLLGERHLARLALVDADGPVILPVNSTLDGGAVVFRTDPGSKLDAATAGATVAVEVDADDERDRTGWSVMVRGQAAEVSDPPTSNGCAGGLDWRGRRALPRPLTESSTGSSCGCLGGGRPRDGRP
jgi:hypothetical protein